MKVEALKQENVVTGKTVYYVRISEAGHEPLVMISAQNTYNKIKEMETGPKVEPTSQLELEITEGLEKASPLSPDAQAVNNHQNQANAANLENQEPTSRQGNRRDNK